MLNLLKNEYIKIFKKKSVIVIFALFLIASIGFPLFVYFIEKHDTVNRYISNFAYDAEISFAETEGYDEYADMLAYLDENHYNYKDTTDWRISAVEMAYSLKIPSNKVNDLYTQYLSQVTNDTENSNNNDSYDEDYEEFNESFIYFSDYYDDYFGFSIPCITSFAGDTTSKDLSEEIIEYVEKNDSTGYFNCYKDKIYSYYKQLDSTMPDREVFHECTSLNFYYNMSDILLKYDIDLAKDKWAYEVAYDYANSLSNLNEENYNIYDDDSYEVYADEASEAKKTFEIAKYRLENHITDTIKLDNYSYNYSSDNTLVNFLLDAASYVKFAGVIIFFIAIGIISKEFNNGTIKFLLISPVKRTSIFWSKVITILSLLGICSLWTYITHYLLGLILSGSGKLSSVSLLRYDDGEIIRTNSAKLIGLEFGSAFLTTSVFLITAIMLSAIFKNGVLSLASVAITYIVNGIATSLTIKKGFDLFKFSLFNNLDVYKIKLGKTAFEGQTATFAAIILITHVVIFLWAAKDAFVKKDI